MSESKFLIDATKLEFNDLYIEKDLELLENVSPAAPSLAGMQPEVIKQIESLEQEPKPTLEVKPTPEEEEEKEEEIKPPIKKH
jgi:outer membrane biosynthesis protein TonB